MCIRLFIEFAYKRQVRIIAVNLPFEEHYSEHEDFQPVRNINKHSSHYRSQLQKVINSD